MHVSTMDAASVFLCWILHVGHNGRLLYAFNDRISQQEQSGWSTSDTSAWRLSLGASTTTWQIEFKCDVLVSKSWGISWSGSESRRLEHNRYRYTQPCRRLSEESTRQNQLYLSDAAQAVFKVKAAARFFCIVWLHGSLKPLKVSGLLSRSGLAMFLYLPVWCFLILFACISFGFCLHQSCLPSRAYSHNGDTWVSCPHFPPLSPAVQLFAS